MFYLKKVFCTRQVLTTLAAPDTGHAHCRRCTPSAATTAPGVLFLLFVIQSFHFQPSFEICIPLSKVVDMNELCKGRLILLVTISAAPSTVYAPCYSTSTTTGKHGLEEECTAWESHVNLWYCIIEITLRSIFITNREEEYYPLNKCIILPHYQPRAQSMPPTSIAQQQQQQQVSLQLYQHAKTKYTCFWLTHQWLLIE